MKKNEKSYSNKMDELKTFVSTYKYIDAIFITETHFILDKEIEVAA